MYLKKKKTVKGREVIVGQKPRENVNIGEVRSSVAAKRYPGTWRVIPGLLLVAGAPGLELIWSPSRG